MDSTERWRVTALYRRAWLRWYAHNKPLLSSEFATRLVEDAVRDVPPGSPNSAITAQLGENGLPVQISEDGMGRCVQIDRVVNQMLKEEGFDFQVFTEHESEGVALVYKV